MTYRSNIDLKEEGKATLSNSDWKVITAGAAPVGTTIVAAASNNNISTSVTVPLPAVLTLSYLYKLTNTTIELGYDKTYWSKYKELDFEYDKALASSILTKAFDDPKSKKWKDTNAYRIGITHKYSNKLNLMLGFAKDENPAPTQTIGFELPDSDATLYSFGFDYKLDDKSDIGFGYLYDEKESRKVSNNDNKIDGEFSNASAHLISFAYRMNF
jgi:long-chain fatty acid transport protein